MSKNQLQRLCSTMKVFKGRKGNLITVTFEERVRVFVILHCVQTFFWLIGGEVTGQRSRTPVLSLKLPSSTWVGTLVPAEELKDIVIALEEEPGPCFVTAQLFLFLFFFFFFFNFYLFIHLWLCWVFVSVRGLSPVAASGGHSSSRCAGLSL